MQEMRMMDLLVKEEQARYLPKDMQEEEISFLRGPFMFSLGDEMCGCDEGSCDCDEDTREDDGLCEVLDVEFECISPEFMLFNSYHPVDDGVLRVTCVSKGEGDHLTPETTAYWGKNQSVFCVNESAHDQIPHLPFVDEGCDLEKMKGLVRKTEEKFLDYTPNMRLGTIRSDEEGN